MLYIFANNKDLRDKIKKAAATGVKLRANPGGSVWATRAEVDRHLKKHSKELPKGLGVFGVKADFAKDTAPAKERLKLEAEGKDASYVTWRDLTKKAVIVALPSDTSAFVKAGQEEA